MSALTQKDVLAAIGGNADDSVVAEILASGTTREELAEARIWLASDEALVNAGRKLPGARVSRLIEILRRLDEGDDEMQPEAPLTD